MAENKKSFILYCDLIHTVNKLPDDKAGLLFKHLLSYVNDENPTTDDLLLEIAFEPIKRQLKRDLQKFEEVKVKRSEAGKLGGRPKKQTEAKKANAFLEKQTKAKKADNDNDNDNDIFIKECSSPPIGVDALHFYIAKGYHKMFYDYKPNKTLEQSKLNEWVNTVRLLIEADKIEPLHLVTIKFFLQSGIDKEKGTDTFWSDTIYSIKALRKKGKDGTYQFDRIKQDAKKWISRNPDKEPLIYQAYQNLENKVNGKS